MHRTAVFALFVAALSARDPALAQTPAGAPVADWRFYGGDAGGMRYSPLTQIDKTNVASLKIAWEYHTGDVTGEGGLGAKREFEATPIVADGTMYLSTPLNRGVALWRDSRGGDGEPCHRRIFIATIDARLIALDAATGQPCSGFGTAG